MFRIARFQRIRPFGQRGKERPIHAPVSPALSKIPYGGFSPVRLQTSIRVQPSSAGRGLICTFLPPRTSTRLQCPVSWTCVPSERAECRIRLARPVALGSATGCSVQPPPRLLWPHPRFWLPSPGSFHYSRELKAVASRNTRTSPLLSACPLVRAVFHTPAVLASSCDCSSFASAAFIQCREIQQPLARINSGLTRRFTRLQSSLYATARSRRLPLPAGTFTSELASRMSPSHDVGYRYVGNSQFHDWFFHQLDKQLCGLHLHIIDFSNANLSSAFSAVYLSPTQHSKLSTQNCGAQPLPSPRRYVAIRYVASFLLRSPRPANRNTIRDTINTLKTP